MPPAWHEALIRAATVGSDRQVLALLAEIPETHSALRQSLAALAETYRFSELLAHVTALSPQAS